MRGASVILALLFVLWAHGTAFAEVPGPILPTPGPDEMVFVGRVPAPAGTAVTLELLDVATARGVVCATATTSPDAEASSSRSTFVLVLQRTCVAGRQDPKVCWADNLCAFVTPVTASSFEGGRTVDIGLLRPQVADTTVVPPHGDGPGAGQGLPAAGRTGGEDEFDWLLWAGLAALAAGIALGVAARALRRR